MPQPLFAKTLRALRGSVFPALMLALALGTVMGLFSLMNQAVLRPIPVPHPDRVVSLAMNETYPDGHTETGDPSPVELKEAEGFPWLEAGPVQQGIKHLRVQVAGTTRSALVAYASSDFFTAMGILPVEGRLFAKTDPEPGAVLSKAAWERCQPALRPGATVIVDGVTLPFLGVLPEGFHGFWQGYEPEVWVPLEARARSGDREARFLADRNVGIATFGRLRPGVNKIQAHAAFGPLVAAWQARLDGPARVRKPNIRTLADLRFERWDHALPSGAILWTAAGFLVVMAALNLGNLQVARWMRESDAWTTRIALGASPRRLVLELSAPILSTLLLGALGAFPVAWAFGGLLARFPPPSELPTAAIQPNLDWRVYLLALGLMALLAIPLVLLAWTWLFRHTCALATRGAVGGLRWRKVLLGTQVALSVALLCGSMASLQDLWRARNIPMGMRLEGVHAFSFAFPTHVPGGRNEILGLWAKVYDRFQAAPGVEVTSVVIPPCEGFEPVVRPYLNTGGTACDCVVPTVYPGTFRLLKIPLLLGRDFLDTDTAEAPPVAIVSAALAHRLWPDGSPLGRDLEDDRGRRSMVIGVVADHLWEGPTRRQHPLVFVCGRQRFGPLQTLLIRSSLPDSKLNDWVEREVAAVDPQLAIERAEPLARRLDRLLQPQRLAATLFGMMGSVALALSLMGLYALQRHLTVQRLPEAGLRMALGASPARVRRDFMGSVLWPIGLGLGVGLVGTVATWRFLGAVVVGLPRLHPATLAFVTIGLAVTGGMAAFLPLLRLDGSEPDRLLKDART